MTWEVEFTDDFGAWWETLDEREQESIDAAVQLLEARGPQLGFPHTSGISQSRHSHMRELRIQHDGQPYRILYAFDPDERQSCSSVETKQATIDGMKYLSRLRTGCTTNTSWN